MAATAPATASPSVPAIPGSRFGISLDVVDLAAAIDFYRILGFEVARVDREGTIFPARSLTSPRFPGVVISLREGFGKRVGGTSPGGVTLLSLVSADLAADIRALAGHVRWVGPKPSLDAPPDRIVFVDRDGYQFELFRPA